LTDILVLRMNKIWRVIQINQTACRGENGESVSNSAGILHAVIDLHKIAPSPKAPPVHKVPQLYLLIHGWINSQGDGNLSHNCPLNFSYKQKSNWRLKAKAVNLTSKPIIGRFSMGYFLIGHHFEWVYASPPNSNSQTSKSRHLFQTQQWVIPPLS